MRRRRQIVHFKPGCSVNEKYLKLLFLGRPLNAKRDVYANACVFVVPND